MANSTFDLCELCNEKYSVRQKMLLSHGGKSFYFMIMAGNQHGMSQKVNITCSNQERKMKVSQLKFSLENSEKYPL